MSEDTPTPTPFERIVDAINNGEGLSNEDGRYLAALVINLDTHLTAVDQALNLSAGLMARMPKEAGDAIWKTLNLRDLNHRRAVIGILESYNNVARAALVEVLGQAFGTEDEVQS